MNTCATCRWWAQWIKERMLGTCGHPDQPHGHRCTDKHDTCEKHEKPDNEGFLA